MPYTLWSGEILVGTTDFALGERHGLHLTGVFQPATSGMMLLPSLTAMAPALLDLKNMFEREHLSEDDAETDPDRVIEIFEHSPEGQRVIASAKAIERLELRAPNGCVLELESILVSDLTELSKLATRVGKKRKKGKKHRRSDRERAGHPEQRDPIRFLISATLATHVDVTVA